MEPPAESHDIEAELIEEMRRVATIVERTPRYTDLEDHANLPPGRFKTTFGSMTMAQLAAGLTPTKPSNLPEEMLLAELDAVCDEAGETVTYREFDERSLLPAQTYANVFGGWNAALERVGRTPVKTNERDASREEVIETVVTVGEHLGRTPTREEVVERTGLKRDYLSKYYGTYTELLEEAGFEPNRRPRE